MPSSAMIKLKMNPRKRKIASLSSDEDDMVYDSIAAMIRQESSYRPVDYLSMVPPRRSSSAKKSSSSSLVIDEFCREQIVEWTYRVVDYFRIDREVVAVSLNYLDRFLSSSPETYDRAKYKLAATTTLSMAVKVVHPQKLGDLGILSDLSRGEFTMRDVANMENVILTKLGWKLHPPTSAAFAMLLLDHCSLSLSRHDLEDLYFNTAFFTELSLFDYQNSCTKPASTIALACILNALEGMMMSSALTETVLNRTLDIPKRHLSAVRNQLWELYERSEECALHHQQEQPQQSDVVVYKNNKSGHHNKVSSSTSSRHYSNTEKRNSISSPVSVSDRAIDEKRIPTTIYPVVAAKSIRNGGW